MTELFFNNLFIITFGNNPDPILSYLPNTEKMDDSQFLFYDLLNSPNWLRKQIHLMIKKGK